MSRGTPSVDSILEMQRDGIGAIADITSRFADADWQSPSPCEGWTAVDLAGHVLAVTGNWHDALDDAEAGASTPRFGWDSMSTRNEETLAALPPDTGSNRVSTFVQRAEEWLDRFERLDPGLALPVAVQDIAAVPITVGLFGWVAAGEWYVHAWDFAQVTGEEYRAPHAESLYDAMQVMYGLTPREGDAWNHALRTSGRRPTV